MLGGLFPLETGVSYSITFDGLTDVVDSGSIRHVSMMSTVCGVIENVSIEGGSIDMIDPSDDSVKIRYDFANIRHMPHFPTDST